LKDCPKEVKKAFGDAIWDLQRGFTLYMPLSKPMPQVALGVDELRTKDQNGIYRTFYYRKSKRGILIFHVFVKKTKKTLLNEIKLGKKRLKAMLREEN
jgi:phage-related protein